jgi:two-component system chemotaxis response regulator CheB
MHPDEMVAVPAPDQENGAERLTGVSCPTCPGVLRVAAVGTALLFRCRIGHVFDAAELIAAKEQRTEELLWAAVEALEELAAILRDTHRDGERAERAAAEAAALRQLVAHTKPAHIEELSGLAAVDQEKCPW